MAVRLARAGYYGGAVDAVLSAPVDDVVTVLEYEAFMNDYESTRYELNREGKK